jgi:CheY-like chemotaxis protein
MVAMLRAYIVDDERLAVQRLTRLIEASGRVEIAGSTTDPEEALAYLRRHEVDVLFLDIQMPGLSGFELLEQLEQTPVVIFTTAFDRYAIDAFAANSIDYLLKPIEPERLDRALAKLERLSGTGARRPEGDPSPLRDIRALARELAVQLAPGRRLERVASRVGERTTVIEVARHALLLEGQADVCRRERSRPRRRLHDGGARSQARPSALSADPPRDDRQRRVRAGARHVGRQRRDRAAQGRQEHRARRRPRSRAGAERTAGDLGDPFCLRSSIM